MSPEAPLISVVTSVYNGGHYLRASLTSVLEQQGAPFELIAIDDGSTDDSPAILADLARQHARLRVLRQENQGLTRALARGCGEARGRWIARHDADDLSLPDRLARQLQLAQSAPEPIMVSCWARFIGPEDEDLYAVTRPTSSSEATAALLAGSQGPPAHGTMMFSADAYRRVGGYRSAFRFAQDWDLWLRLAEVGPIAYVPAVLYAYRFRETSISAQRRDQQLRLLATARKGHEVRARGEPEAPLLEEAERISCEPMPPPGRTSGTDSYFIGKCLLDRRDRRAIPYLRRSVKRAPWCWRPWLALAAAYVLCRNP